MKKMKFLIAALLATVMLAGCSATDTTNTENTEDMSSEQQVIPPADDVTYTALIISHSMPDKTIDVELKDSQLLSDAPAASAEIKINGKTVKGTFTSTQTTDALSFYPSNHYSAEGADFAIDHRGVLVYYTTNRENSEAPEISIPDCAKIAKEFVCEQMASFKDFDIKDYKISVSKVKDAYFVNIVKMLGDIPTDDSARVTLSLQGQVIHYNATILGMIDTEGETSFSRAAISKAISDRLDDIYKTENSKIKNVRYDINDQYRITVLKNGTYAVYTTANVSYSTAEHEAEFCISDTVGLIIQ